MPEGLDKMKFNIKSLNYSTILTVSLIVILTLWSELSEQFKIFLASITGHHWVTKGIFSLIFFVIIYSLLSKTVKDRIDSIYETVYTVIAVILGGIIIFGFYVWHFVS